MRAVMQPHFADGEFAPIYENQFNLVEPDEAFIARMKKKRPRNRLFFGHFSFGVHRMLGLDQARYLTLLRDPVQRVDSFFGHVSRDPGSRYYRAIQGGMDLSKLVLSHLAVELNNHVVRMLLGDARWGVAPARPGSELHAQDQLLSPNHLKIAIDHIERHFTFVGTAERFADSVSALGRLMHWPAPPPAHDLPHCNCRPDPPAPLDEKTRRILADYNALDIELFQRFSARPFVRC